MRINSSHVALWTVFCLSAAAAWTAGCSSESKQPAGASGGTGGTTPASGSGGASGTGGTGEGGSGGTGEGGSGSPVGSGGGAGNELGGSVGTGGVIGSAGTGGTGAAGSGAGGMAGTRGAAAGSTGAGGAAGDTATGGAGGAGGGAAGGTGGGAAGGAGGCPGVFCEDFEKGSLDTTVWTLVSGSATNTAKVQGTTVAHGSYALQFHTNGGNTSADGLNYIMMEAVPARLTSHFYGRAYFNIGSAVQNSGHQMFTIAGAKMPGAGFPHSPRLEVGASGGKWQLTAWANETGGGEAYGGGGTLPTGKWVCIEWEVQAGATNNLITVSVEGVQQATETASSRVSAFSEIGFGYYAYSNPPAFDIYLDDIVLDTKPVACLP
jgi:hypothetical protein